MFDTVTNAASTPVVPEDRWVIECLSLEEAPPFDPTKSDKNGIRWILGLYDQGGRRFNFQGEPYAFYQTTTANMAPGARAREYAEAFLGRQLAEGEKLSPNMLLGKKCVGFVVHEFSRNDKTKKVAKLTSCKPFVSQSSAPPRDVTTVSVDPTPDDVDRALIVSGLQKSVARLKKMNPAEAAQAQAAIDQSELDTAPLAEIQQLWDSVKAAIERALDD